MGKSFQNAFLRFVQQHKLFDPSKNVLLALSGGVDSMVLLHLLLEWQKNLNLSLAAIHINHQLRGKESEQDQKFVQMFCEQKKIQICIEKVNIRKFAKSNKYSLEEAGHILRERIYEKYLEEAKFDVVATAHNLNDQAETILMHILEGTGLDGLAGIYLKKDKIVRPLLFATRNEIEKYAGEKKILYREDQSNKDLRFKRNKIRHQLLPFINKEFSFSKLDNFLKMSLILQDWQAFSDRYRAAFIKKLKVDDMQGKISFQIKDFQKLFSGIQIKVLEDILQRLTDTRIKLNYNIFHNFMDWLETGKDGTKFQLHAKVMVNHLAESLIFQYLPLQPIKIKLGIPSENVYNLPELGIQFVLKEVKPDQVKFTEDHSVEFIDKEKIKFPLILRNWESGDKFQPLGIIYNCLVSDFLTDLKIEFPRKKTILVLEQGGEIVVIPGYRISEKFKLNSKTKRVLKIELRKN
jgi:tRNA(Ile)-lysidine synthase